DVAIDDLIVVAGAEEPLAELAQPRLGVEREDEGIARHLTTPRRIDEGSGAATTPRRSRSRPRGSTAPGRPLRRRPGWGEATPATRCRRRPPPLPATSRVHPRPLRTTSS